MFDLVLLAIAIATGGGGDGDSTSNTAQRTVPETLTLSVSDDSEPGASSSEEAPPGLGVAAPAAPEALPFEAEPQVATGRYLTALEVKPILGVTRASWVAVRDFNGQDLVYVTHIWAWRCGLVAMRFAVNGEPLEYWPLPECREATASPAAILEEDGPPYRVYPPGSVETVTVEVIYDDLTREKATFNRLGVLLP